MTSRVVTDTQCPSNGEPLTLHLQNTDGAASKLQLEVDAVFVATGYTRNAHEEILGPLRELAPSKTASSGQWTVQRNYKVKMDDTKFAKDHGIWLKGCTEDTHGLADSLLSILAPRSGEMVDSIFGNQ